MDPCETFVKSPRTIKRRQAEMGFHVYWKKSLAEIASRGDSQV